MIGELVTFFCRPRDTLEVNNICGSGNQLSTISASDCDPARDEFFAVSLVAHQHEVI